MRALGGPKTFAGSRITAPRGQSSAPAAVPEGSSSVVVSDSYREEAKAAGGVVTETLEQSWFRATSTSPAAWLAEDEDQRRYRIEAASRAAGVPLAEGQREALLQRLDEVASKSTGQPTPVYRGVPVAGTPYDAPSSGPYVPAGEAYDANGCESQTSKRLANAFSFGLGALIGGFVGVMLPGPRDYSRSNPSKRRKRSWWSKWFGGSPSPVKRKKKRA